MPVTGHDLITEVNSLRSSAKSEAAWRCICSRSYYAVYQDGAAFHNALTSIGSVKLGTPPGMHQELIERLKNPTIPRTDPMFSRSIKLGYAMATLHAARIVADYKRGLTVTAADAENCLAIVDSVVATLAMQNSAQAQPSSAAPVSAPVQLPRPTLTRIK